MTKNYSTDVFEGKTRIDVFKMAHYLHDAAANNDARGFVELMKGYTQMRIKAVDNGSQDVVIRDSYTDIFLACSIADHGFVLGTEIFSDNPKKGSTTEFLNGVCSGFDYKDPTNYLTGKSCSLSYQGVLEQFSLLLRCDMHNRLGDGEQDIMPALKRYAEREGLPFERVADDIIYARHDAFWARPDIKDAEDSIRNNIRDGMFGWARKKLDGLYAEAESAGVDISKYIP